MQRDGFCRDLCAAWAWDKADAAIADAVAQPSADTAGSSDGGDTRQNCSTGSQWMVVDVTGGRLPGDGLQGAGSGGAAQSDAGEAAQHSMPGRPAAPGAAHATAALPPPLPPEEPQQQRRQRLTHRLLVASSGGWIQSFSGSGCDGPVAPVVSAAALMPQISTGINALKCDQTAASVAQHVLL